MALIKNSGTAIVDSDPNGITELQSGHSQGLAYDNTNGNLYKFDDSQSAGSKWVLIGDGGGAFIDVAGGNPTTSESTEAYRTALTGFGESSPTEIVHITSSGTNGAYKFQYTYADGTIVRNQSGGMNIGTEYGLPAGAGAVRGVFQDYINDPDYPNCRGLFMNGDFLNAGAQKNYGITIGTFRTDNPNVYSATFHQPLRSDLALPTREDEWLWKAKAINPSSEQAHLHLKTRGRDSEAAGIPGYDQEPLVELEALVASKTNRAYLSPHYFDTLQAVKFSSYGSGTYVEGYTHSNPDADVFGAATFGAAFDADGNVIEVPLGYRHQAFGNVNGAVNLNIGSFDSFSLTITGNTTLTTSNLPPAGESKTVTIYVSGNAGLGFPAAWTAAGSILHGSYVGTAGLHQIVIEFYEGNSWGSINHS